MPGEVTSRVYGASPSTSLVSSTPLTSRVASATSSRVMPSSLSTRTRTRRRRPAVEISTPSRSTPLAPSGPLNTSRRASLGCCPVTVSPPRSCVVVSRCSSRSAPPGRVADPHARSATGPALDGQVPCQRGRRQPESPVGARCAACRCTAAVVAGCADRAPRLGIAVRRDAAADSDDLDLVKAAHAKTNRPSSTWQRSRGAATGPAPVGCDPVIASAEQHLRVLEQSRRTLERRPREPRPIRAVRRLRSPPHMRSAGPRPGCTASAPGRLPRARGRGAGAAVRLDRRQPRRDREIGRPR